MGAIAASISAMLDGIWVNTIVLIRPMRRDSHAATGKENAENTPDQKKKSTGRRQRHVEPLEQPQRQQRLDHEAAGEGIEAEQRRKLVDDLPRRPERGRRYVLRRGTVRRNARVDEAADHAEKGVEDEHQP